ncbi:hypothetical protein [Thioclava sediminum]|uniref:hypothetical protein n=1 Tax=Thioclava sediminum TaxID=1915319 RepID=UPI0011BADFEB|nr:hypothetical protein [Thioclava sediminum]
MTLVKYMNSAKTIAALSEAKILEYAKQLAFTREMLGPVDEGSKRAMSFDTRDPETGVYIKIEFGEDPLGIPQYPG